MAEPIVKLNGGLSATKDLLSSLSSITSLDATLASMDAQPWLATNQKMIGTGNADAVVAGYGVEATSGGATAAQNAQRLMDETAALAGQLTNSATTVGELRAQALKVRGMIVAS